MKNNLIVFLYVPMLLTFQQHSTWAQDFNLVPDKKKLEAKVIGGKIIVDGKLSEIEWENASIASGFTQIEPNVGEPSNFETEVKVLYTTQNIYIGVLCNDKEGNEAIRATDMSRDFASASGDYVSVIIDGLNDRRNAAYFGTNAYGAQVDYLTFDGQIDIDWSGLWKVRTSFTKNGWVAEFEIPYATIQYKLTQDSLQSMAINFERVRRKSNERSVWSPFLRNLPISRMEFAGELTNLSLPKPSTNIRLNPYSAFVQKKNETQSEINSDQFKVKFGGDIKWGITTNTVADITLNTDFAQAEADVQVNNTSRFSVLFPEKRQFFLENASLFGAGLTGSGRGSSGAVRIIPFFSRRVGLDASGTPIPLDGGVRIVHRSLQRSIGALAMHQAGPNDIPSSSYYVARYTENVGKQNRLGGLLTIKSNSETPSKAGYANVASAIDGFFRFGKLQSLNSMVVRSTNSDGSGEGMAGFAHYQFITNTIQAVWTESFVTENFSAESGFISRGNVLATTPRIQLDLRKNWVPLKKYILSFQPSLSADWYHQFSDRTLVERYISITPVWYKLTSGGSFGFSIDPVYQNLLNPFKPLGIEIEAGDYSYTRYRVQATSDQSKKVSYSVKQEFGEYYNGNLSTTNLALQLAPVPYVSVKLEWNRNQFAKVGVLETDKTISLYSINSRFSLNARLQLSALYQRNTQQDVDMLNVRFSWEYKPLSYVYLVWNSKEYSALNAQDEQFGIFKINFVKQF